MVVQALQQPKDLAKSSREHTCARETGQEEGALELSPFVVLAGQRAIDELADGARLAEVVQEDHQRHVCRARLPVDLVGQVGEVQLQVLQQTGRASHVGLWHGCQQGLWHQCQYRCFWLPRALTLQDCWCMLKVLTMPSVTSRPERSTRYSARRLVR